MKKTEYDIQDEVRKELPMAMTQNEQLRIDCKKEAAVLIRCLKENVLTESEVEERIENLLYGERRLRRDVEVARICFSRCCCCHNNCF